jgi:hypothetical protein
LIGWLLLRAVRRLAGRMPGWPASAGGQDEQLESPLPAMVLREGNLRLQQAIKRLERRLFELEQSSGRSTRADPSESRNPVAVAGHASKLPPAKGGSHPGVLLTLGAGESLLFLPHEQRRAPLHYWRGLIDRIWKRIQPARAVKGD